MGETKIIGVNGLIELIRQRVLPHFGIATDAKVAPLGNGHINDTFLVRWPAGEMVLQRINTRVFTLPQAVVNNAHKIAQHLHHKVQAGEYRLKVVEPVPTTEAQLFLELGDAGFWRAINYLPHSHSIEVVSDERQAYSAAQAFGHFSRALSDFDATAIEDVIPKFHHLPNRIAQLKTAVHNDSAGRLSACQQWVDLALSQQNLLDELAQLSDNLPLRICHNDTKINNMLYDKRDMSSLAIIDLDTCMKGHLMYDFGDMVRTFTSPEAEDSTKLEHVQVRESIFAAICQGYLSELAEVLSETERQSLWLGAQVICLMIGVRFLTDHLNGDVYFHVHHENHNLQRAANQFTLYLSLLSQQDSLLKHLS